MLARRATEAKPYSFPNTGDMPRMVPAHVVFRFRAIIVKTGPKALSYFMTASQWMHREFAVEQFSVCPAPDSIDPTLHEVHVRVRTLVPFASPQERDVMGRMIGHALLRVTQVARHPLGKVVVFPAVQSGAVLYLGCFDK